MSRKGKSTVADNKLEVAWGEGWEQRLIPNEYEVSFLGNGNILKLDCDASCTTLEIY